MTLSAWDAPTGAYTSVIPPGTVAFRFEVGRAFGYTRTEVIRDRSRCNQTRSEHCECGGIDLFTTDPIKGRILFNWCVANADALGVQSVIFRDRQIGFGNPTERHRAKRDHFDHVHVGLNRWARKNLTRELVRSKLPTTEEDFLAKLTEQEQKRILDQSDKTYKALFDKKDGVEINVIDVMKEALARIEAKLNEGG